MKEEKAAARNGSCPNGVTSFGYSETKRTPTMFANPISRNNQRVMGVIFFQPLDRNRWLRLTGTILSWWRLLSACLTA